MKPKITTQKNVEINQRGRTSKYRWLYEKIDQELKEGEVLLIENAESIKEARLLIAAIRRQYENMEIHLRKYNVSGFYKPTIYLNWR